MNANPTNPTTNSQPAHMEAPASWNVRYSQNGYACQFTLRGESGGELLPKAEAALAWLVEHGAVPDRPVPMNGNGHTDQAPKAAPVMDNGAPDPAWCSIHGVAMSRHEKDGRSWYSHKIGDGQYCKGKA